MTIVRVKPAGWVQDVSTIDASEINQIDINCAKAIDGTGGGAYAPTSTIEIAGQGLAANIRGLLTLEAGTIAYRPDFSTLSDGSSHTITYLYQEVHSTTGFTGVGAVYLDRTTVVPPIGARIRLVNKVANTGMVVQNDGGTPGIFTLTTGSGGGWAWGEAIFDGTNWITSAFGYEESVTGCTVSVSN